MPLEGVGDGRLAGFGQPGEPDGGGLLPEPRQSLLTRDPTGLLANIGADLELVVDLVVDATIENHSGGYRRVADGIDQDEVAGRAIAPIGIEGKGPAGLEAQPGNLVEL